VGNRSKTCQSRSLFPGYLAELGHLSDKHSADDRSDP
jgi:hypothetical protein